jgi:hypothetical protein
VWFNLETEFMRTMSIAAIAIGLIASASISASAADQTITESFSLTIPSSAVPGDNSADKPLISDSTLFPQFAPTIGTLESVNVTLSGVVSVVSFMASPQIIVGLVGGLPIDASIVTSGTTNLELSGLDRLISFYIGTGTVSEQLVIDSAHANSNESLIESNGPLKGDVTYTFAPATVGVALAVPETPTWAAMLIGFGCLGFAAYRTTRRTSVAI